MNKIAIQKTTYKDQVIEYIFDLVLEGRFSPGDQIKESLLAKELGISRAPVREALRELIVNGIIEYRPQVGNFISLLSPKQIVDAYTTRGILEGYAIMSTCTEFDDDDFDELESMVERMKKAARRGSRKVVVQIGGEFHDLLTTKNKNVQLAEFTEQLSLKLHILFFKHWSTLYSPEEIGDRHMRILAALQTAEPAKIEACVRDHYIETGTKIADIYQQMLSGVSGR